MPFTVDTPKTIAAPSGFRVDMGIETPFAELATIFIDSLPDVGYVTYPDGTLVQQGDFLTAAQLRSLVYESAGREAPAGTSTFTYTVVIATDIVTTSMNVATVARETSLIFAARDGSDGEELWRLDSNGMIEQLADISPGLGFSEPRELTEFGNALYFRANDGASGQELWRLTNDGTVEQVADLYPGPFSSLATALTPFGNSLYFTALDDTTGAELWRVTETGTVEQVADINPGSEGSLPFHFTEFNDALYFAADDDGSNEEVWRVTASGTVEQVTEFNPFGGGANPDGFTEFDGALYFAADNFLTGRELWRITATGAVEIVANINPGVPSSSPQDLVEFNGALYFNADGGTDGRELWRLNSNGTVEQVADIRSGSSSSDPFGFTEFNGALYFAANDGISGNELWRVTSTGSVEQVADIRPGSSNSSPFGFTEFSGALYFSAATTEGFFLHKVNSSGAVEQVTFSTTVNTNKFTEYNGALYFDAEVGGDRELYRVDSDGNVDLVADINPFSSSSPSQFTEFALFGVPDGTAGDDVLIGTHRDEIFSGGAGADIMDGGGGSDTATYIASAAGVTVNLITGTGTGGDAEGDMLTGIENLIGSTSDDTFTANDQPNRLDGRAGSDTVSYENSSAGVTVDLTTGAASGGDAEGDTLLRIENLIGSAHNDSLTGNVADNTLTGGAGNDSYYITDPGDTVIENVGEGYDRVYADGISTYTLGANVERLTFQDSGNHTATGNELANRFDGNAGNDTFILDAGGSDIFSGGQGQDTFDARAGLLGIDIDLVTGSHGGDAAGDTFSSMEVYWGSNSAADVMVTGAARAKFYGFGGNDNLTGGATIDYLDGGTGNDTLNGMGADDGLRGFTGDDTLTGGAGRDYFQYVFAGFDHDTITDYEDGLDYLRVFSAVADEVSDFTIAGNGTSSVTLALNDGTGDNTITLNSGNGSNITIDAGDFLFY
ncbi:hypothetical protein ACFQ14_05185 [Pseudahrensia aquimaris]|uniref:ELWxxDGT repeat-containing protein n=1 Tax=Pseudahrensia aquimaris TaxID=744461 RepID=A0ABW3FEU8_9HYPH